jgi:hypothetical protein
MNEAQHYLAASAMLQFRPRMVRLVKPAYKAKTKDGHRWGPFIRGDLDADPVLSGFTVKFEALLDVSFHSDTRNRGYSLPALNLGSLGPHFSGFC